MKQFCVAMLAILTACAAYGEQTAEVVYTNGTIYTVDEDMPWASELGVQQGRIVCVGAPGACDSFSGLREDLQGRFVMPGFIDSHNHVTYARGTGMIDLAPATNYEEFRALIEEFAAARPDLPWIIGDGWNYSIFPSGMPNYRDLEGLADGRPMMLISYDAHTKLLNRTAMNAFGLTDAAERTPIGSIVRDIDGKLTGIFKAALYISEEDQKALNAILPPPDEEDLYQSFLGNLDEAASVGITTIVEPQNYPEDLGRYERARREGKLKAHIRLALYHSPNVSAEEFQEYKAIHDRYRNDPDIRVPALKLYVDDVIESETAAVFEPYVGSENVGELFYDPEEFKTLVTRLDAEGFQLFIHAIGDRGIHTALDALEAAKVANGKPDAPHQLVHLELMNPDDIDRLAALDVSAAIQPRHLSPDITAQWAKSVGEARHKYAWPLKSLADAGTRFAFSSDWNVAEMNPFIGIFTAVNRTGLAGNPEGGWQPQERIDLATALEGYTIMGAISNGIEADRGSLEVGKFADLVFLNVNPFEVAPLALKDVQVLKTVFQGRAVYDVPTSQN
ncbi:MAG: amidohydrolase family protein [Alphaproteobacteria bacterium]|nr:amidohydrolase family protein [Alphaproteobacteria bacterium]